MLSVYYIWQRVRKENFISLATSEPNEKMLRFVTFLIVVPKLTTYNIPSVLLDCTIVGYNIRVKKKSPIRPVVFSFMQFLFASIRHGLSRSKAIEMFLQNAIV